MKFLPMPFGTASQKAFCTDFPAPIEPSSTKLIPAGAVVFLDPELTLKNQAVVLGYNSEIQLDFLVADFESTSRKLHSLTNSANPKQLLDSAEIIGVATGYAIYSSLSIN
jgi:hypothetical protein